MVRLIGISVSDLLPQVTQTALFDQEDQKFVNLSAAIDKVRDRYGFTSVQTGGILRLSGDLPTERRGQTFKTLPPSS